MWHWLEWPMLFNTDPYILDFQSSRLVILQKSIWIPLTIILSRNSMKCRDTTFQLNTKIANDQRMWNAFDPRSFVRFHGHWKKNLQFVFALYLSISLKSSLRPQIISYWLYFAHIYPAQPVNELNSKFYANLKCFKSYVSVKEYPLNCFYPISQYLNRALWYGLISRMTSFHLVLNIHYQSKKKYWHF